MRLREKTESVKDQEAYKTIHGGAAMLSVITPKRDWLFAYTHFLYAEWDPSKDLVLVFATHQIRITGRHLKPVYDALSDFSLSQVAVVYRQNASTEDENTWIDDIQVINPLELKED